VTPLALKSAPRWFSKLVVCRENRRQGTRRAPACARAIVVDDLLVSSFSRQVSIRALAMLKNRFCRQVERFDARDSGKPDLSRISKQDVLLRAARPDMLNGISNCLRVVRHLSAVAAFHALKLSLAA